MRARTGFSSFALTILSLAGLTTAARSAHAQAAPAANPTPPATTTAPPATTTAPPATPNAPPAAGEGASAPATGAASATGASATTEGEAKSAVSTESAGADDDWNHPSRALLPPYMQMKRRMFQEDIDKKVEGGYVTGLPLVSYDPNTGFGAGVR